MADEVRIDGFDDCAEESEPPRALAVDREHEDDPERESCA